MRLLLAVDTLKTLDILINFMEARSWPKGTEAGVLSVVEDETIPAETWRAERYGIGAVRREMQRRGEQISDLVVERLRAIGIPAQVTIMRGDPAFLIPFAARKWSSDLILIRANNRMKFRNWLLGSVAKSVVEYAPCSVEVVRADQSNAIGRNIRILLPTDGYDASLAATQAIAEMQFPRDTEVKVVSVINPIKYSLEEIGFLRGKDSERAHHAIGKAVKVLGSAPLNITAEVMAGRRVRQIVARARDWDADLIVVGTAEREGLKRVISRGTAVEVANRAHCSVRVVRGNSVSNREQLPRGPFQTEQDRSAVYGEGSLRKVA
jgi:nucleotide-binding universal stress UspA family protein